MKSSSFLIILTLFGYIHFAKPPLSLAEPTPIRIGWIGPQTGPAAALGVDSVPAIQIAFDEVNKGGGINGRKLELIVEDDQYETAKTVTAFKRLTSSEKLDVIYVVTYGGLFAVSKIAERQGVVLLDPLDCDDSIAALGSNTFCVSKKTEDLGITNANFAVDNSFVPAAFLYFEGDPFMGIAAKATISRIDERGGKVLFSQGYPNNTSDFKSLLMQIKELSLKSVFFYGYDEMCLGMKQARALGICTQFFSLNTITSPGCVSTVGKSANGTFVASWLAPRTPAFEEFLKKFVSRVGRKPFLEISTIPSFDIANLIVNAVRNSPSTPLAQTVKESLYKTNGYQGLSGKITIDPDGITRSIKNHMFIYEDGALHEIKK